MTNGLNDMYNYVDYCYGKSGPSQFTLNGLTFIRTCLACPEQYDVELDGKTVGYVRLRYGILSCYYPNVETGKCIYKTIFEDDPLKGIFDGEVERTFHLTQISNNIINNINHE